MNRIHRASLVPPRTAGFSLVETLVSFALLGLTATTVLSLLVRSGLNNLEARRAEMLVEMARSSIEGIDGAGDQEQVWCPSVAAWQEDCGAEAPQFRRFVRSVPVLEPGLPGESVEIIEVTVEVTALRAGRAAGERTMRLVTLRLP
ncbi:MAG: type II secretion system protein [Acidobacteria bacterium]|nr:type II secretion system protein [Acidobacteriota bacterium]